MSEWACSSTTTQAVIHPSIYLSIQRENQKVHPPTHHTSIPHTLLLFAIIIKISSSTKIPTVKHTKYSSHSSTKTLFIFPQFLFLQLLAYVSPSPSPNPKWVQSAIPPHPTPYLFCSLFPPPSPVLHIRFFLVSSFFPSCLCPPLPFGLESCPKNQGFLFFSKFFEIIIFFFCFFSSSSSWWSFSFFFTFQVGVSISQIQGCHTSKNLILGGLSSGWHLGRNSHPESCDCDGLDSHEFQDCSSCSCGHFGVHPDPDDLDFDWTQT